MTALAGPFGKRARPGARPGLVTSHRFPQRVALMLFKTLSASVFGIDAYPVEVEVDVTAGKGILLDRRPAGRRRARKQ